jgi:plastocyanin
MHGTFNAKLGVAGVGTVILIAAAMGIAMAGKGGGGEHSQLNASMTMPQAPDSETGVNVVTIDNFTFAPQSLAVPVGTTVTWINRDDIPHTIKGTESQIKSTALDTDDKFSFTFTEAGEFPYFCGIHPHMTGKIVVK